MSNKEKLPKLVDVYRSAVPLSRRQLPLVVDESLTLVMDVKNSGLICDTPLVRGKELEEFTKKWDSLSEAELRAALQITKSELMHVLNQNVPCVGCRRSVERLYYQLFKFGHPTLDPLQVKDDGVITIKQEKQVNRQVLCSIFHDHSIRLAKLIENQPKRNKKSLRCLLHSLDSQRRCPVTPVWRDVWDCMKPECKKDVCIIEAAILHTTLETYLRKHRFCGECRTKVLKAYALLVEEPEPCKEKGYVSSLYAGIKRCLPDKHIHLQSKTDYITKLISRAEPELLGRERHAKTLEIAQEEVLTCLGICMYERLHRIYMRMREEECTCQVFAAVAVDTLSRSFETAVERKQGISQLELLYAELTREEQQKQIRKEQKKIKRKRKKGKALEEGKENCNSDSGVYGGDDDEKDDDKECSCSHNNKNAATTTSLHCYNCENNKLLTTPIKSYDCAKNGGKNDIWLDNCKCEQNVKQNRKKSTMSKTTTTTVTGTATTTNSSYKCNYLNEFKKETNGCSSSDHSHDCGYSSENNNGCCETGSLISSISSSPDGSELAYSDTCCHHDDYVTHCRLSYGLQPSLQDMLEGYSDDDDDDSNSKLTPEEVWEFKNNNKELIEKRQELREALKKKFLDFCAYGPLQVPRLLVQSKYASN